MQWKEVTQVSAGATKNLPICSCRAKPGGSRPEAESARASLYHATVKGLDGPLIPKNEDASTAGLLLLESSGIGLIRKTRLLSVLKALTKHKGLSHRTITPSPPLLNLRG